MSELGTALELRGVTKRFPGTVAVRGVDLAVYAGEVHAVVGENGAGKSTLMKIVAGAFDDYEGEVLIGGQAVALHSPARARAMGIAMIHQELSLAAPLSVAENILAGRLPVRRGMIDRRAMLAEARRCLGQVGLDGLDPRTPAGDLPPHEAQLVEIAKALGTRPCILVMDEPTSALSRAEVERLFAIIRRLRQGGLAILYISHHMPEILELADRVTVMRDGRLVATRDIAGVTAAGLVEQMIGGATSDLYAPRRASPGAVRLRVEGLTRRGFVHDCSFEARGGEIVGLAGLSGAGRTELARALCGLDPSDGGRVTLDGAAVPRRTYGEALRGGIAYLAEDRKAQGLALRLTAAENLVAAVLRRCSRAGVCRDRALAGGVARQFDALRVQPPEPAREVSTFSGGNQQKVLLARWLEADPEVLILDEPTRGVDIGAKAVIHRAIAAAADRGKCVILISSDLPELVGLSDRILVMRRGRLIGEMSGAECTEEAVLLAANGEMPQGEHRTPNVGHRTSNEAQRPTSNVQHPTSKENGDGDERRTSNVEHRTSNAEPPASEQDVLRHSITPSLNRSVPFWRRMLGVGSVYFFVLLLLLLGRGIAADFWSPANLVQVLKDVSILGIVAVGVAFVTLSGHYVDLSIPAIMACSGIVSVALLPTGFAVSLAGGMAAGTLLGWLNGFMVGRLRLNPILWTLAAMSVADGITRWAYGGKWIYARQDTVAGAAFADLYRGDWFGFLPVAVALFALTALAGDFVMRRTVYGRQLKFTGASYEAARFSGIPVRGVVMRAFALSGAAAALAGILKTSFSMYGDVEIGLTYDFQAVTAVVIGGVTLAGGRGTMAGVIGGVLVIGLLGRILPLIPGIGQDQQFIIRGIIFVAAVGLNLRSLRRAGRSDA